MSSDTLSWDWREQPDLDELAAVLAKHGVRLEKVDTGRDDYEIRISSDPRQQWTAALRWAADELHDFDGTRTFMDHLAASKLAHFADEVESGALTPWADTPQPAATPAVSAADSPAAVQPPTGTPGGGVVLGYALLDRYGHLWQQSQADPTMWWHGGLTRTRDQVGPVREVLLVSPTAGKVLKTSVRARLAERDADDPGGWGKWQDAVEAWAAAVDAMVGKPALWPDTPTTRRWRAAADFAELRRGIGGPDHDGLTGRPLTEASQPETVQMEDPPAGTFWERAVISRFVEGGKVHLGTVRAQVKALLADRDRLARIAAREPDWEEANAEAARLEHQRDQARAEPYTPEELEAGAKAVDEWRVFVDSDGYRSIRAGSGTDLTQVVLSAAAPLIAARVRAGVLKEAAQAVEEYGGPDPSPASPAWWAGWLEGQQDAARIVREFATTTTPEEDHDHE